MNGSKRLTIRAVNLFFVYLLDNQINISYIQIEVIQKRFMLRKVDFTYFKTNGKMYTESTAQINDGVVSLNDTDVALMFVVVNEVRQMNKDGKLPGLQSGKWNGYILITCSEGYPHLIVPDSTSET